MFKVNVPFLNRVDLNEVVTRTILKQPVDIQRVMDGPRILGLRTVLEHVVVAEPIRDYAVRLVLGTHPDQAAAPDQVKRYVRWGASPRAGQALIRAARVRALSEGRAHAAMEDVRHFVEEVFQHRVLLNYDGQAENIRVVDLLKELVAKTPEVV